LKILGIDPGLSKTGIAILSREKDNKRLSWELLEYKKGEKRLLKYFQSLKNIIEKEKPDNIVIESTFRGPNTKTLIKVAELRGVYLLLTQMKNLSIQEFSPREIKQSVTGSGASSKKQVKYMVQKILNIDEDIPLDISDAFGAIICYLNRNKKYAGIY
jgi:crossover junction endodeoxyribonuclease RuvC